MLHGHLQYGYSMAMGRNGPSNLTKLLMFMSRKLPYRSVYTIRLTYLIKITAVYSYTQYITI